MTMLVDGVPAESVSFGPDGSATVMPSRFYEADGTPRVVVHSPAPDEFSTDKHELHTDEKETT